MIKLAITGNIASGKSLIEFFLVEKNIPVIDTDKIVHNLFEKNQDVINKVQNLFDVKIIDESGKIIRNKVASIVFSNRQKLKDLESIIHPEVKKEVEKFVENNKNQKIVAVSVPQLYETGWEKDFDYVLLVAADEDIRIKRLMNRNNLSEEGAKKRIEAQLSQKEKIKLADFVIFNNQDINFAKNQLEDVLEKLKKMI